MHWTKCPDTIGSIIFGVKIEKYHTNIFPRRLRDCHFSGLFFSSLGVEKKAVEFKLNMCFSATLQSATAPGRFGDVSSTYSDSGCSSQRTQNNFAPSSEFDEATMDESQLIQWCFEDEETVDQYFDDEGVPGDETEYMVPLDMSDEASMFVPLFLLFSVVIFYESKILFSSLICRFTHSN